jgi:hypothetical protein
MMNIDWITPTVLPITILLWFSALVLLMMAAEDRNHTPVLTSELQHSKEVGHFIYTGVIASGLHILLAGFILNHIGWGYLNWNQWFYAIIVAMVIEAIPLYIGASLLTDHWQWLKEMRLEV